MEIKIVKNAPINDLPSVAKDLQDMLVVLFNESNIKEDAIFLDKERVFKNRQHDNPFPSPLDISLATNAIRSNCVRFAKKITIDHSISISKAVDKEKNFTGLYIKFKNKNLGDK